MNAYNHHLIEEKWQKRWEESELYKTEESMDKQKSYLLVEFPYPSGDGLHTGHVRSYTGLDIVARKRRMEGYNVLYPMGWDAFGLPAENYALKTGTHPSTTTKQNIETFRRQLKSLGFSFDWSREVDTTDPEYYKWTQWIFLQFFKRGLAYQKKMPINWCPSCKIGLSNEEAEGGTCERCDGPTEIREKEQWMLAITKYADRLIEDLDTVDYPEKVKIQQRNWIGRSEGAKITFSLNGIVDQSDGAHKVEVFTTRPDTIFGATFLVVSPELAHRWIDVGWQAPADVYTYVEKALARRGDNLYDTEREKTGVPAHITATNPAAGEEIPVWISNYVLGDVGSGAVMAVPAHDQRDFEFAQEFELPIRKVIKPHPHEFKDAGNGDEAYTGDGTLMNSGDFNERDNREVFEDIISFVDGEKAVSYKLRDWVFSRQRYWGEPIPLIHCKKCGIVPVAEEDLPVKLPDVEHYQPTDTGESPLAAISEWVKVSCPSCDGPARRETDTMPQWAGSSWYYLRYVDPDNNEVLADKEKLTHWTPVDWYNGGMEHTTLHLLYSRFWHKFLYDEGYVPTPEPYAKRTSQGLILAEGGVKMSKSKGNVVNPDEIVDIYGADTLRLYEMFMGPFGESVAWNTESIIGPRRFLERVWNLADSLSDETVSIGALIHKTIKGVSDDIEHLRLNTAVSKLMILVNEFEKKGTTSRSDFSVFVRLLAPFAPHITEELWEMMGGEKSIHIQSWPKYDESQLKDETVSFAIQVNGKVRGVIELPPDSDKETVLSEGQKLEGVKRFTEGKDVKKTIFVPGKVLNIVVA